MTCRMQNIINADFLQGVLHGLYELFSFPSRVISSDKVLLASAGNHAICTMFCSVSPADNGIFCHINHAGSSTATDCSHAATSLYCPHGLQEVIKPLIVDARLYGYLCIGPYLTETPDLQKYRTYAQEYGLDESAYLRAIAEVPVWSETLLVSNTAIMDSLFASFEQALTRKIREHKDMPLMAGYYQTLLQTAMDGFWLIDGDGWLQGVNDKYLAMSGYQHHELVKMHVADLDTGARETVVTRYLERGRLTAGHRFETKHRCKDGRLVDVEVSIQYRSFDGGRYFAFLRDITERKRLEESLLLKQRQYHEAHSLAEFGHWEYSYRDRSLLFSDELYQMLGWTRSDFDGTEQGFLKVVHPDDREALFAAFDASVMALSPGRLEFRLVRADGTLIHVLNKWRVKCNEDGSARSVFGTIQNVTEQKAEASALRSSRQMLNTIINTVPQAIFWKDRAGRYLGCNSVFAHCAGVETPEDLIGLTDHQLVWAEEESRAFREDDREVMRSRAAKLHIGERLTLADGRLLWVDTCKMPLCDERGDPVGVLGIFDDMTERRAMEEALEKKLVALTLPLDDPASVEFEDLFNLDEIQSLQDQFASAFGIASLISRPDGSPLTEPSNFCRLCRDVIRQTEDGLHNCMHSDAVIGRLCLDGPTVNPCLSGGLWDAGAGISVGGKHLANWLIGQVRDEVQNEDAIRAYARTIGADEDQAVSAFTEVPAMSRERFEAIAQLLYSTANYLSTLAYQNVQQARLISDLKRSEKEQRELQSRLIQAQKMESVGRLAGGVAHDFNNMLSIIGGNTELILKGIASDSPFIHNLEEIHKAFLRSVDLTRQLLTFARKQRVMPRVVDLNESINSSLSLLRRLIGEDVELTWRPGSEIWPVRVDPSQIDQILANLCTNARDSFGDVCGQISIETHNITLEEDYCRIRRECAPGDYLCVAVGDNGCGIAEEIREKLFEPFFTTKEVGKGTGLGLATVYGIMRQNNGFVSVYSEPGTGSTFRLYFPRHRGELDPLPVPVSVGHDYHGKETVLLVEDETAILELTQNMLERLGYRVMTTSDPHQAVELFTARSQEIDLLVTDVIMPGMSGRELADRLICLSPQLKVLYISGYTTDKIAAHGVGDKAAFLSKPFSSQALSEKIRRMLEPSSFVPE